MLIAFITTSFLFVTPILQFGINFYAELCFYKITPFLLLNAISERGKSAAGNLADNLNESASETDNERIIFSVCIIIRRLTDSDAEASCKVRAVRFAVRVAVFPKHTSGQTASRFRLTK